MLGRFLFKTQGKMDTEEVSLQRSSKAKRKGKKTTAVDAGSSELHQAIGKQPMAWLSKAISPGQKLGSDAWSLNPSILPHL